MASFKDYVMVRGLIKKQRKFLEQEAKKHGVTLSMVVRMLINDKINETKEIKPF